MLWLWRRPLAWEPPDAADAPLEKTKKRKKKKKGLKEKVMSGGKAFQTGGKEE